MARDSGAAPPNEGVVCEITCLVTGPGRWPAPISRVSNPLAALLTLTGAYRGTTHECSRARQLRR
jgi:hypothetical protein